MANFLRKMLSKNGTIFKLFSNEEEQEMKNQKSKQFIDIINVDESYSSGESERYVPPKKKKSSKMKSR